MPTYEAGSRPDNIMKSINNWIAANVATGLGLTVYYEGQGRIGALPSTWVESFVIPGGVVGDLTLGGSDRHYTETELLLNLNVFQVMDSGATGLAGIYALETTATNLAELFGPETVIVIRDYNDVGEPQEGGLQVVNTPIPTPVPTPTEMGIEQMNLSVRLKFNSVVIN